MAADLYTEVVGETVKIAMASGLGLLGVVAIVIVAALLRVVVGKVPRGESGPPPQNDETPAPGSPLPTDPNNPGNGPESQGG